MRKDGVMVTNTKDDDGPCPEDGGILTLYNTSLPRQAPMHNPYFSSTYFYACALSCRSCLKPICIKMLSYESY
jgi:hypothetical protein